MSGKQLLVDTNILIYFFDGQVKAKEVMEGHEIFVATISEIELLGYLSLSVEMESNIRNFLKGCNLVELDKAIRERTIRLKQKIKIKVPDAIIAATALELGMALVTEDRGFRQVDGLSLLHL